MSANRIHPMYGGTWVDGPVPSPTWAPGEVTGKNAAEAAEVDGIIVTASSDHYFYDPELKITGTHFIRRGDEWHTVSVQP